jgi:hypothetical protein
MTTLRVLLREPPRADRADAWALLDDAGALLRDGAGPPAAWPSADAREAVIAAERARLVVLTLPPLPASRLPQAVAYALEDQLAGGDDPPRVARGAQQADGRVVAAIAARTLVEAIDAHRWSRIVPEAALPPLDAGWTWYASGAGGGFVRTPAGSFAASPAVDALPAELAVALAQATRAGDAPDAVRVAFDCEPARLARYAQDGGVPFTLAPPWRWTAAPLDASLPDWRMQPMESSTAGAGAWRLFRPAFALAAAAFVLHVGASLVEWAALRFDAARTERAIIARATAAGVPDASSTTTAVAGLVRRHADARHRVGLPAPGDALPLLGQAAPALAGLPRGALKAATYADGAWTLELARVDGAALTALDRALALRGIAVLQAPGAGGVRMRLTASP